MGKAYDVAVIGAGAIGSSVAYFNAKKGASVVLIDAGDILIQKKIAAIWNPRSEYP